MAKLHFKYGTMNSGKSIDLMRTAHNYEEVGYSVLVLKPLIDTKGEDKLDSRFSITNTSSPFCARNLAKVFPPFPKPIIMFLIVSILFSSYFL